MINKLLTISSRSFKNFGHKREPVPRITNLWHGFLTFTFIGLGIEWKRVTKFFLGDDDDTDTVIPVIAEGEKK